MVEKRAQEEQQLLFARSQTKYAWKNVQSVERGNFIVIKQEEVRILGLKPDNDFLMLSYTDPVSGTKAEQLFNLTDYVYTRL
ncbi:hypothetical protein [Dictyobacter arantiisoli]|uniref:Uncharacterized protein n=1 Tax=Dictyobacter arantiisoli TaxID=2014874 RepID=A0A5A5TF56_9CHLR|nr:hypothetical protein [Dictyobacter arantiisoli]GCF09639.1 hypothetical protein KDI_32030 [Dictyobacter arantiisoli]